MLNFDQKSPLLKNSQKTCFLPLFVQNKLKIDKNSALDVAFSHFVTLCLFSELHAKKGQKLENLVKC